MRFSKYQGIGNDFVMIADLDDEVELGPEVVRALCDRRFGIGGDGVIRVAPASNGAEFFMDYINSDGSIGEMCGNGIRCLALFAREQGLTSNREIAVSTRAGIKIVEVFDGANVRVDMGPPSFEPDDIPVVWDSDPLHVKIELEDRVVEAACLSMGNPHAVMFVDDLDSYPVTALGPRIEHHPMFPNRVNAEFVVIEGPDRIRMRVWERGSGETLACGTGAAAGAVASRLLHDTRARVTVVLRGGALELEWNGSLATHEAVFMTGPAAKAFEGEIEI